MAHQDANQAWPALVAKELDADFHNISWSGAGVVWNAGGCSSSVPFHDLYSRGLQKEWQPDAIVLYLGGNDWWSLRAGAGEDQLVNGFRRFLQHLRELRGSHVPICILLPAASSVCACIGSLEDQATFAADMSRCWQAAAKDLDAKACRKRSCLTCLRTNVCRRSTWMLWSHSLHALYMIQKTGAKWGTGQPRPEI